jgi:23S rRNA (cytosine1962-C5)-methyltransferase
MTTRERGARSGERGVRQPPAAHQGRPKEGPRSGLPELVVSRTTARFIADGHPWVRPDRFTRGLERLRLGEAVTLIDDRGKRLASALVDPPGEVCARVYHRRPDMAFDPAAAVRRAWECRAALHADPDTTAYRVVHGEGDFLPGLRVERFGEVIVVVVFAMLIEPWIEAICRTLHDLAPEATIVLKDHTDDLRRAAVQTRIWCGRPLTATDEVPCRELGIEHRVQPAGGLATGLYVDQRATRAWLTATVLPTRPKARVLNLFAYTGAFSLACLHAGAGAAVDVDLAGTALARGRAAAERTGVADRLRTVQQDCGAYLAACRESFDVIICDPPTAAQGGGGWVLRRDYPAVIAAAARRLAPGGVLVACCNTLHGKPFPLDRVVAECGLAPLPAPGLGEDVPLIAGFPEGRPFRLIAAFNATAPQG